MTTENIIKDLLDGNISDAKEATENLLYSKVNEMLNGVKEYVTDSVYGVCEAKKKKDDDEEETKYAKDSDAENDSEDDSGETLDAVGDADSDVDNDGDSDESDEYLKNRRKVRKKDIEDEEEVDEGTKKGDGRAEFIYGIKVDKYNKLSDSLKAKLKQKWHSDQSEQEKEKVKA
jgi:hypothetical protein